MRIHGIERRLREARVHVVEYDQPRAFRRERALHRVRPADSAIQRPGAQGAAADPHQAHRIVAAANRIHILTDVLDHALLKRQVRKPVPAGFAQFAERRQGLERPRLGAFIFRRRNAVRFAGHAGHQIFVIEVDGHIEGARSQESED